MKAVLLGTTGYHPNDRRHTSCIMLPDLGIVLDAGTGMFRVRKHLCTPELDIYLSHGHLDHVVGLTFLFDVLWESECENVRVHVDRSKIQPLSEHLFAETLFPVQPPFTWHELQTEQDLPGGGKMTTFPLVHPGGSIGFRLDWPNHSLAYVTDTTAQPDSSYIEHIRDVDLLIHECYFPDGWEDRAELTGHSCLSPVVQNARAAMAKRLVLVHINPLADGDEPLDLTDARREFADVIVGEDGMELEF